MADEPCRVRVSDYTGLDFNRYLSLVETTTPMHRLWSDGKWLKVQLASGCYWHKCKFCDVALDYIGRYAAPDPKQAVDAMLAMRDSTGVYSFHFTDEAIPPSLCKGIAEKFFASDDAPCKISRSVLHEYLSEQKYADEPYATAARFWFKSCTRMDVLEAVSAVCTKKFGNKINQVDGMDASRLYMAIVKFIPPDKR